MFSIKSYIVSDDFTATWSSMVPKGGFHVVQLKMPVKVWTSPVSGDLLSSCQNTNLDVTQSIS